MVLVPGGTFTMGSPTGTGEDDERPQHTVTLRAFCMDRLEVTVAQYTACPRGTCSAPDANSGNNYCNWGRSDRNDHPVNCVDWNQASAYCRWRGGNLPTEDQWEYAARGTDGRTYPWGNTPPDQTRGNFCGTECGTAHPGWSVMPGVVNDGFPETAPVGRFAAGASPFGLLDMAGNVWEWTRTPYGSYTATTGPATVYRSVDRTLRVFRGGCWGGHDHPSRVRAGLRSGGAMAFRIVSVGFRCVREGS